MSFINKATLGNEKAESGQDLEEKARRAEQVAAEAREKKEKEDENLKKNLNDPKFLNFLQKHPEAVANATDDEYLKEKVALFEQVKKVGQEVKSFISLETRDDFKGVADDVFLESVERVAISNPGTFVEFSEKISAYLSSVESNKALEETYQAAAGILGIEADYGKMSAPEKIKFIKDVHAGMTELEGQLEQGLEGEKNLKLFTRARIPFTQSRENWKARIASVEASIQNLKLGKEKLDRSAIMKSVHTIEAIKDDLKSNQAFGIVKDAFKLRASAKIQEAMAAKNDGAVSKDMELIRRLRKNGSILEDGEFEALEAAIVKYSKESVAGRAGELVTESKDVTLKTFERGVDSIREKGLKNGLTREECNEQIATVLKAKIDELDRDQNSGQNRIKLILAKRILSDLE